MSFWRFGFGTQSSIDTLLGGSTTLSPQFQGLSLDTDTNPSPSPVGCLGSNAAPPVSLDRLLDEEDLLQEFKTGHAKLTEFMSNTNILRRMLEYISGEAFDLEQEHESWPQSPSEEQKNLEHRIKYPHICAEMLLCDNHAVMTVLFSDIEAFLVPFWNAVLDKSPQDTAQQNVQMAHWSRVNCFLLSKRPVEILALFKSRPAIVQQLVRHLQSPPIADFLFRIVQTEELPEGQGILTWLADQNLVPLLAEKLSPTLPPATHLAASEFLRSVITFCANANTHASNAEFAPDPTTHEAGPAASQQGGEHHTKWGLHQQAQLQETKPPTWVSNILLQQLASQKICSQLLGFALDQASSADAVEEVPLDNDSKEAVAANAEGTEPGPSTTPFTPAPIEFPTDLISPDEKRTPTTASTMSSLTTILSIYVDLIRKNNSDFTEQQLFQFMRKHASNDIEQPQQSRLPPGPTVVDLSAALDLMRQRLPDMKRILSHPQNAIPIETAVGKISPLTPERFKICELLAELLHCSHMALLNRPASSSNPTYTESGALEGGYARLFALENALSITTGGMPRDSTQLSLSESTQSFGTPVAPREPGTADADQISAALSSLNNGHPQSEPEAPLVPPEEEQAESSSKSGEDSVGFKFRTALLDGKFLCTALDLFFQHPWHNFLHSVVYDLVQQVITSNNEDPLNRSICISLFKDGHLTTRILEAQKYNDEQAQLNKQRRLGYMGHLSLLAEEVVKLFVSNPQIYDEVRPLIALEEWSTYVETTLRKIRETDLQPLGGGVTSALNDTISSTSSLSDEDDEFPGRRRLGNQTLDQSPESPQKPKPGNKFSQYFAQQLSGDRPSASDSDDEDGWTQSQSAFPAEGSKATPGSSFDDDFGDFEGGSTSPGGRGTDDAFSLSNRPNLTSADWNSEFKSSFSEASSPLENPFAGGDSDDDDGSDFGDFQATPQITVPSFDSDSSFDYAPARSSFDAGVPGDDESSTFGNLRSDSPEHSRLHQRPDGLVEGTTSDGETVVVPPDELELSKSRSRSSSASSGSSQKSASGRSRSGSSSSAGGTNHAA